MECTLKIVAGPDAGQEFQVPGPEAYIGRSQRCLVRLSSPTASFEHALISRVGDEFFIENLSANGTLINNQRLLAKTRLRTRDQVQIGAETVLRIERLPAAASAGANRRWLLVGVVLILLAAMALIIVDPFSGAAPPDQKRAYAKFLEFSQRQVENEGMPPVVPDLLKEAWRLRVSGDREGAAKTWIRLHVQLDQWDIQKGRVNEPLYSRRGLDALISGEAPTLNDNDMRIAFKQWVVQMERGGS